MNSITQKEFSFKRTFFIMILFSFLTFSLLTTPATGFIRTYSVKAGTSYNFDVVNGAQNSGGGFGSRTFTGSFPFTRTGTFTGPPGGFGGGFGGIFGNFSYQNFVIRPDIRVPATGTIYSVTLTGLPTNSTEGTYTYDIPGQASQQISSYYAYGEPVISTNWTSWKEELNSVMANMKTLSTVKSVSYSVVTDSATEFSTSITVDINPPTFNSSSSFNFQISDISLNQIVVYEKATGLRQSYTLNSQITSSNGARLTTTQIDYTTASTRLAPSSNSSNDTLLFIGLGILFVVLAGGLFVYRTKLKKPVNQSEFIKTSSIKQKALIDDLKERLKANDPIPTKSTQTVNLNQNNVTSSKPINSTQSKDLVHSPSTTKESTLKPKTSKPRAHSRRR